jgi:hypothetical protein
MRSGFIGRKPGRSNDERACYNRRTPVVAALGNPQILSELERHCSVMELTGDPQAIAADVLLIDTNLAMDSPITSHLKRSVTR